GFEGLSNFRCEGQNSAGQLPKIAREKGVRVFPKQRSNRHHCPASQICKPFCDLWKTIPCVRVPDAHQKSCAVAELGGGVPGRKNGKSLYRPSEKPRVRIRERYGVDPILSQAT